MNAAFSISHTQDSAELEVARRVAALNKFAVEEFQNLSKEDLLLAQTLAGHGDEWGVWKTSREICPSKLANCYRTVNFAKRLRDLLAKLPLPETSHLHLEGLVQEGVLVLTRLALLIRLLPSSGFGRSKGQRLKPSTLALRLHSHCTVVVARSISKKAALASSSGLLSCLTEGDLQELSKSRHVRNELERLGSLAALNCWTDLPQDREITHTTDPSGPQPNRAPQQLYGEYQPISDRYLEEIGPRVLWVIHELGPRLLPLLEELAVHLDSLEWHRMNAWSLSKVIIPEFISGHLSDHPWIDKLGRPLKPNFPLMSGANNRDNFEFPPRGWSQLKLLSATLQSAHLFLTLLSSAGRIGEVETLPISCVTTSRDNKSYIQGWTYKLSDNLFGEARTWPAPTVLVEALGQQARLVQVWSRLPPGAIQNGLPKVPPSHRALWISLGVAQNTNAAKPLARLSDALMMLPIRIGMDPKPGGINLHPHRLRKTIGRLAGIALFNSPTALKRLFGHKSIEMTLHYILCDKGIQTEAEAVLRELRIMHCAEALEEVRDAIASGTQLPAHSGAAASRLADAIKEHEARLTESGRVWRQGSAYDLAYVLTASGKGWRFVQKNIICAKVPGEAGLCMKNRGEPNTSNCQTGCDNRIVLEIARRDADEILEAYMNICLQALEEEQFDTFHYSMGQLLKELDNFSDIKEKYLADPQMQSLLSTYKELDE